MTKTLKIAFVGPEASVCISQHLHKRMLELGHESHYVIHQDTIVEFMDKTKNRLGVGFFSIGGNPFSLKILFETAGINPDDLDIVFVEQNRYYFLKDIKTPVIYYHRDLWTEVFIRNADMILYRFENTTVALKYISRSVWSNTKYKIQYRNGVDMDEWFPNLEKKFKGLNYIHPYNPLESYLARDYVQRDYYTPTHVMIKYAKDKGWINVHGFHKIKREEFKWILGSCEAYFYVPPNNAYLSRILYEAAASKTLLVIFVPFDFAQQQFNKAGLVHGLNCIMIRDPTQMMNIYRTYYHKKDEIVENAFKWAKTNTYEIRTEQLVAICHRLIQNLERDYERRKEIEKSLGINQNRASRRAVAQRMSKGSKNRKDITTKNSKQSS